MPVANIIAALKRRFWVVLLFLVTIGPIGLGIAYILPPVYSASARILVESQQIPDQLAQSTVTATAQERLQLIRQLLLTRENLIDVLEKHDVFGDSPGMPLAARIARLRDGVKLGDFEPDAATRGRQRRGAVVGMSITYTSNRPVIAAAVVNEFVSIALDLNLRQRTERATETVAFFEQETRRLAQQLAAHEAEIIAFKRDNSDALPDSASFRSSQIVSLGNTAYQLDLERATLVDQRQELVFSLEHGVTAPPSRSSPQQNQLDALRNTLIQQQGTLAPSHPQIRALEGRIAALEREVALVSPSTGEELDLAALQKRQMERQIARIDEQIATIDRRKAEIEAEQERIRASNQRAPQVEIDLLALERRFGGLQSQLAAAESKRSAAATGEKLEVNRQAERFVVIEQAQVPTRPISPNRPVIAGAGVGASLALGVGLVVLLELMNKSIRSAADLQSRVGLRPIIVVPYIHTRREIRGRRMRWAAMALIFLIGAPLLLYLIDQHYMPLSSLAEMLMRVSGLNNLMQLIERRL